MLTFWNDFVVSVCPLSSPAHKDVFAWRTYFAVKCNVKALAKLAMIVLIHNFNAERLLTGVSFPAL